MFALVKLAVVIVNYNVRHFLEQCLRSVLIAGQGIDMEVWVVDNNSVDGSVDMVRSHFPEVRLIANTDNVGFSCANNQAIRQSQAQYILLLNPDTVVPADCFAKTLEFMDAHPDAGALGIRMIDGQGRFLPESKRGLPTPEVAFYKMLGLNRLFPRSKKFGKYHLGYLDEHQIHKVDVLSGAFMLLRKEALDKVGLLDETFFMYGEDIDLSYRIQLGGYANYYFPETTIIHYKGESTKKQSVNYVRIFYKAMIIFAGKHYKGRYKALFTTFINLAIYLRAGLSLLSRVVKRYGLMFLEAFLIFGSLYYLKEYWEEHIKHIKEYPPAMLRFHLPYYTLSWLLSLLMVGSYKQLFNFGRLIRGTLIGTAIILIIFGLLPEDQHFSRGIILFGFLVVSACLIAWRSFIHLLKYGHLDFSRSRVLRSVLVGDASQWERLKDLIPTTSQQQHLGFVGDSDTKHPQHLGSTEQLHEIVQIYGINEVVFNAASIDPSRTMELMNRIGPQVAYFSMPEHSDLVIGSHSRNSSGSLIGRQIEINLSKPDMRRQKRLFDILSALALIVLFPLGMWHWKPKSYFSDCFKVLFGSHTWISYADPQRTDLPPLRPGIYRTHSSQEQGGHVRRLDNLYAQHYTVMTDVRLLWKAYD